MVVSSQKTSTWESIKTLAQSRGLVRSLTGSELKGRYRASALGIGWALVRPLTLLAIYGLVVGQFLGASRSVPQFGLFLFVGFIPFTFLSAALSSGSSCITANSSLVKKVRFPRESLPLVAVIVSGINAALMVPILILGYIFFGTWPHLDRLLLLIPATLTMVLLAMAGALFFSALNVYSRDVEHLMEVVVLILFWMAPIVYPWTLATEYFNSHGWFWLSDLYVYNPINSSIIAYQNALWPGIDTPEGSAYQMFSNPWSWTLWQSVAVSLVLLWLAHRFFLKLQGNFAREL